MTLPRRAHPRPLDVENGRVDLTHGGGGRAMAQLVEEMFIRAFDNEALNQRNDQAAFDVPPELLKGGRMVMTTDGYVISPLFFPGGDIGSLAVHGTVNDVAMAGAVPLSLSAGFIIEEGFPLADLQRIVHSMAKASREAGVPVVTGDTKVVERGKADGLFINTSGIGRVLAPRLVAPSSVQPGDAILVSGDIGRHGIAVMAARHALGLDPPVASDCAPLAAPVRALLDAGLDLHCLRDLTRGGLASALAEIAAAADCSLLVEESAIPVCPPVTAVCELLGLDPLHVASEGRFVAFVPAHQADPALDVLRRLPVSAGAALIGTTRPRNGDEPVTLRTTSGVERALDMPAGEQLPRIC